MKRLAGLLVAAAGAVAFAACGQSASPSFGDDGGTGDDATVGDDGASASSSGSGSGSGSSSGSSSGSGSGSSSGSGSGSGSSSGSGDAGGWAPTGPVTCGAASTAWQKNGSQCGSNRWALKTGTDGTVGQVNMTPKVTTVQDLIALPTSGGTTCTRSAEESVIYALVNVTLRFEHLETDSDYHLLAIDKYGHTVIVEVPYPDCVGQHSCSGASTPWLCEITHARAAVDAKNPTQAFGDMGVGTVVGAAFFDTYEQQQSPQPTGMAANAIELHPVLGICFGQGCDPFAGY